ncbi:ABC transporter permease [Musicola paradisiaca]
MPTSFYRPRPGQRSWRRNPLPSVSPNLVISASLCLMLLVTAILAPCLAPFDPNIQNLTQRLCPPSALHWFGTDGFGRDVLSRVIYGTRPAMIMLAMIVTLTMPLGLLVGISAGYLGGWGDRALMRLTDIVLALPGLVIALALVAVLGAGLMNNVLALALTSWPHFARQARAETLALKNSDFLMAARMQGIGGWRLMYGHILPFCLPGAVVRAAMTLAHAILAIAGLGFLGVGAQPPMSEWGKMVADGSTVMAEQWWVATAPGVAIFLTSLIFNLLGNGLRDRLDPRHGNR